MHYDNRPIGVFDSGVGGLTVLKTLSQLLPDESFVYYGDSLHAPYGEKSRQEILTLSKKAVRYLLDKNVKALVLACNTATSTTKAELMRLYPNIPIFGIEPALKPAVKDKHKHILVLATPLTLKLEKFQKFQYQLNQYKEQTTIHVLPCPGLANAIEKDVIAPGRRETDIFLDELLKPYRRVPVDAVVLGCTHYPLIKDSIKKYFNEPEVYDGYTGLGRHLKTTLEHAKKLADNRNTQTITFLSSDQQLVESGLYTQVFEAYNHHPEGSFQ